MILIGLHALFSAHYARNVRLVSTRRCFRELSTAEHFSDVVSFYYLGAEDWLTVGHNVGRRLLIKHKIDTGLARQHDFMEETSRFHVLIRIEDSAVPPLLHLPVEVRKISGLPAKRDDGLLDKRVPRKLGYCLTLSRLVAVCVYRP